MEEFSFVLAGIDQLDRLLDHRMSMWREIYPGMDSGGEDLVIETRKWLTEKLSNGSMLAIIAMTSGGSVAGSGCILVQEDEPRPTSSIARKPHLLSMYTEKEFRGRGVARMIVERAIKWARDNGFDRMTLNASVSGRPLYEKMGFRATNEMQLFLQDAKV